MASGQHADLNVLDSEAGIDGVREAIESLALRPVEAGRHGFGDFNQPKNFLNTFPMGVASPPLISTKDFLASAKLGSGWQLVLTREV